MKKKCLECGDTFIGRSDKKFCSDMCRNSYHNKYNGYRNAMIRHVNHKLRKNRHILFELIRANNTEISKEDLTYSGFDWQFFTEETKLNQVINRFCYDYGIEMKDQEDQIKVISKGMNGNRKKQQLTLVAENSGKYK